MNTCNNIPVAVCEKQLTKRTTDEINELVSLLINEGVIDKKYTFENIEQITMFPNYRLDLETNKELIIIALTDFDTDYWDIEYLRKSDDKVILKNASRSINEKHSALLTEFFCRTSKDEVYMFGNIFHINDGGSIIKYMLINSNYDEIALVNLHNGSILVPLKVTGLNNTKEKYSPFGTPPITIPYQIVDKLLHGKKSHWGGWKLFTKVADNLDEWFQVYGSKHIYCEETKRYGINKS